MYEFGTEWTGQDFSLHNLTYADVQVKLTKRTHVVVYGPKMHKFTLNLALNILGGASESQNI